MYEPLSTAEKELRKEIARDYPGTPSKMDKIFRQRCSECEWARVSWVTTEGYKKATNDKRGDDWFDEWQIRVGWICLLCQGSGVMSGEGGSVSRKTPDFESVFYVESEKLEDDEDEDIEWLKQGDIIERTRISQRGPRTPTKYDLAYCRKCFSSDIAWVNPNAYVKIMCGGVRPEIVDKSPSGKGWVCLKCAGGGYIAGSN